MRGRGRIGKEIGEYLDSHDVLDELIDSFVANGFFATEPLLVMPEDDHWIVVEGTGEPQP